MSATILKANFLMTPNGLQKDWGLRIEGNRITEVAPSCSLTQNPDDEVVVLGDQIILPGFVNGHNHMYGFLSHGITAEALVTEFSSFLDDFWWPYVEDRLDHELVKVTTQWACVEMIDSGVTSFMDILEGPKAIPNALDVEETVVTEAGLRGRLSFEACQRMGDEIAKLGLDENANFIRKTNSPSNLVQGMMSVHTLFTCDKPYLKQAKQISQDLHSTIHMHLSESVYEPNWCKEHYGKKPVEVYDEIGYLDNNVLASQVVQCDLDELDILAKRGVRAVSMPLSNCEVGGGVAPVGEMLKRGMTVGLGTDGYINNFFEVMRGAFLIHKAYLQDPQAMPAKTVYQMATSMGADALGIKDAGRLQAGCLADIITVSANTPTPINEHNVYDQLILFCNPKDVENVIVDGRWLKRDSKILTLQPDKIKENLRKAAEGFWQK